MSCPKYSKVIQKAGSEFLRWTEVLVVWDLYFPVYFITLDKERRNVLNVRVAGNHKGALCRERWVDDY